jgi:rod shape-determining protein MreB
VRVGGTKLDEAIIDYARRTHSLIVGDQTAEAVKIKIGSATKLAREESMNVKGRDSVTGLPRTIVFTSTDIYNAMQKPLAQIVGVVKSVLEETPPELSSDIIDKGIVMSGGTSTLRNLDALLTKEVGVPAYIAEDPLFCVVRGTGRAMENIDSYRRALK